MDDAHTTDQGSSAEEMIEQPFVPSNPEVNFFGATNFRNQNRKFGIKIDDRRRHMYVVGKTGMGKTTLLENMILNDIYAGHGAGYIDPHGDTAEKLLNYIPAHRINDVVYFNPADLNFPIGFNILETIRPEQKHLVASGLMAVFKKIWPDVWSARMEYILNNTILALLDFPGTTLLGINRMLSEEEYRRRVVANSKDPVVKAFWQNEFASYTEKFRTEAVAPIQNKIGQFLSASVIRNIVAQVKSRINIREIMDEKKIFIMNLSKGRIGEDNSRLLGGMLVNRIQLAAMERVDILEKERKDFFLYVDEFQNFATESFANILSEARKYRLDLIMAHQYMEQLDENVMAAVIGNVGTMVTFRVGSTDAEILAKEFTPTFVEEDLVNLPKFQIYLKLMIDGVASRPFSAMTLSPIAAATGSAEKVIRVSRERYAVPREKIEEKIMRWSGLVAMSEEEAAAMDIDDDEAMIKHPPETPKPKPHDPAVPPQNSAPRPAHNNHTGQSDRPRQSSSGGNFMSPIMSKNNSFASNNRGQGQFTQGGGRDDKKRKRKRKGRGEGGGNFSGNPRDGQNVQLVDSSQRGISLSQAIPELRESVSQAEPAPLNMSVESPVVPPAAPVVPPQPSLTPVATTHPVPATPPPAPVSARVELSSEPVAPPVIPVVRESVKQPVEPVPKPEPAPQPVPKTEAHAAPPTPHSPPKPLSAGNVVQFGDEE